MKRRCARVARRHLYKCPTRRFSNQTPRRGERIVGRLCKTPIGYTSAERLASRVLAGEANSPGAFSKRTIAFLSDLSKTEAEAFTTFCGFVWRIGDLIPVVFNLSEEIYAKEGLTFSMLSELDKLGLIDFQPLGFNTTVKDRTKERTICEYYGKLLTLGSKKIISNLEIGRTLLTKLGKELFLISGSKPVAGMFEYVVEKWKAFAPQRASLDKSAS